MSMLNPTDPTLVQTDAYLRFAEQRALMGSDTAAQLARSVGDTDEGSDAWCDAVQLAATAWSDAARMARDVRDTRARLTRQLGLLAS